MPNKIVNTPDLLKGLTFGASGGVSSGGTPSTSGTRTPLASVVQQRKDNPKLALGTIGTKGPDSGPYAEDALTLTQIEEGVKNAEATTNIRKRAVKIAYSYIGNNEVKGSNIGFYDPLYQAKFEGLKMRWKDGSERESGEGDAWCNCFTNLVWKEAFTTGNALVPAAPQSDKDNWVKYYKNGKYGSTKGKGSNKKIIEPYMALSKACAQTAAFVRHYKNGKYFITKDQAFNAVGKDNKNMPKPGDMFIVAGGSHICLVVKVFLDSKGKIEKLWTIDGNASPKDYRDGGRTYKKTRKISDIKTSVGFCKLEENYT